MPQRYLTTAEPALVIFTNLGNYTLNTPNFIEIANNAML